MKSRMRNRDFGLGSSVQPRMNPESIRIKKLGKDQRGFTILELVIVMLLTGLITTAITTTFFQVFEINARTANHMTAVSQVQQAGKLVSEDILQAQDVYAGNDPGTSDIEIVTLNWTDSQTDEEHQVIYTLEDDQLWRSESIDGGDPMLTRVAEHISSDSTETSCELEGDVLIFKVTATVGEGTVHEETEQRIYRVQPRPGT